VAGRRDFDENRCSAKSRFLNLVNGSAVLARLAGNAVAFGCCHMLLIVSPPLYPVMETNPVFRPTVFEPSRVKHAGSGDV
jgi:hypothetical protein